MKLLVVALALAFVAVHADHHEHECGPLERLKVKHQWQHSFGFAHDRLLFGLKLWNKIFKNYPKTRELFARVDGDNTYSATFEAHAQRVLGGLDMTISLLDDPATLNAQLEHLKSQHAERGIKAEAYDLFTEELLDVLPDYLGHKLDYGAWKSCMAVITTGIKS